MLFTADVVVPAGTEANSPKVQTLKIARGIISWVSVLFPPGCNGMVYCTIAHHEHQIAPSTEQMTMSGNADPIEWNEYYKCYQLPHELKIRAWSPGTTYDHTISVRVAILPREGVIATSVADAVEGLLGTLVPKPIPPGGEGG